MWFLIVMSLALLRAMTAGRLRAALPDTDGQRYLRRIERWSWILGLVLPLFNAYMPTVLAWHLLLAAWGVRLGVHVRLAGASATLKLLGRGVLGSLAMVARGAINATGNVLVTLGALSAEVLKELPEIMWDGLEVYAEVKGNEIDHDREVCERAGLVVNELSLLNDPYANLHHFGYDPRLDI